MSRTVDSVQRGRTATRPVVPRQPGERSRRRRRGVQLRNTLAVAVLALLAVGSFPWLWRTVVELRYAPYIYDAVGAPQARVAIVFGARVYRNGMLSAMLRDRVDTAVDLYHAGKVEHLLLSGGRNGDEYDEPAAMRAHALSRGVPPEAITTDHAGNRTYDTCYRAGALFGVDQALLVTQEFHLPRAMLLCNGLGVQAAGVKADRRLYAPGAIAWSETRETPALLAALVDLIRRVPPPSLEGDARF